MRFVVALCLTTFAAATTDPDYYSDMWGSSFELDSIMPPYVPGDFSNSGEDVLVPDIDYPNTSSQFTESSTSTPSSSDYPTTSEMTPNISSKSPVADGEKIFDYFSRHIDDMANISARLVDLERIVSLQASLIAIKKRSIELVKEYALGKFDVAEDATTETPLPESKSTTTPRPDVEKA